MDPKKKCGTIAIVGQPNVGKSTLLNYFVGTKLSITSRKAQTTRYQLLGICSDSDTQYIFVDTPGYQLRHLNMMNRSLNKTVHQALKDVDVILFMIGPGVLDEIDNKILKGIIAMPSDIFATTGAHVSIIFIEKNTSLENVILMDASGLGQQIKEDNNIIVSPVNDSKSSKGSWGLIRTIINNMIVGVEQGFTKSLIVNGVGYRASVSDSILTLQLGYSHDIKLAIPKDIEVKCPKPTEISISGIDKQKVGQYASEIRSFRKPEPYKGKGIMYEGETILRKAGKSGK